MSEEDEKELNWPNKMYMLQENEIWLNEQIEQGLALKKFNDKYVTFSKGEAEDIKYKIVILNPKNAEKQIKIIEHQGFRFVADYKEYYIFYIRGKYGHFQPRLNEESIEFARKWFNKQILKGFTLAIIALLPMALKAMLTSKFDTIIQSIVEMSTIGYLFWIVFFMAFIMKGIKEYKIVRKCKRCFIEHEQYIKKESTILSKILDKMVVIFFIVIAIFGGIYLIYFDNENDKLPISSVYNDMPFVFIQDIEEPDENELKEDKSNYIDRDSYAEINSTFLAPKQYLANQDSYNMYTHYYEVRFKGLVKSFTKELIKTDRYHINKNQYKKIEYDGFDIVYVSKDGLQKNIAVSKGEKVMLIEYHGEQPAEKILEEMAEVL